MQPYQPLKQLGPGLWCIDGEWYETAFRRRMTVLSVGAGAIVVHNAFILKDEDLALLRSLGKVVGIIIPNVFHGSEAGWMAEKCSEARVFAPAALLSKLRKQHRIQGSLENDWPAEWSSALECLPIEGLRFLQESAFFHKSSRTLVLTDLVFNMSGNDFKASLERKLMAWNRVGNGFGPSRLCDTLYTRDKQARQRSIEKILSWNFDRIIVNHGQIVASGGKELLRAAFEPYASSK